MSPILPLQLPKIWVDVPYIAAAAFFIASIIGLGTQKTAKKGNFSGILGMLTCVVSLYCYECIKSNQLEYFSNTTEEYGKWGDTTERGWYIIPIFLVVGCIIGIIIGAVVEMTAMPLMVGILNALGGFAATLEGIAFYVSKFAGLYAPKKSESVLQMFFLLLSIVIGLVTFVGSILAAIKINSNTRANIHYIVNVLLILIIVILMVFTGIGGYPEIPDDINWYINAIDPVDKFNKSEAQWINFGLLLFFSSVYGVTFVLPIGGADMPVVIALLNAFSGMSGCFAGFLAQNKVLIITGAIVASSGCILSYIMCKAMNRSLINVLFGAIKSVKDTTERELSDGHPIDTNELFSVLSNAKNIMIIPGYGMASAKAQGEVAILVDHFIKAGKQIRFGIHPVAGRLPGHMNVLLAEVRIPYDIVYSMDEINDDMKNVDVCLIVGANDTVNPDAMDNPNCGIYGMPVIKAWEAKTVVVLKRNLGGAGYSDVFNPLLHRNNSRFYKGNSTETLNQLNKLIAQKQEEFNSGAGDIVIRAAVAQSAPKNYTSMPTYKKIGIPRESGLYQETRVALSPDNCGTLRELGFEVFIESKAGLLCNFTNRMYKKYNVQVVTKEELFNKCDIIVKINEPTEVEVNLFKSNHVLISYADPDNKKELLNTISKKGVKWIAMDKVPRTTFAQKFDSLSSAGKISGYRAVIESLYYYQGFISQQITASGKYPQAKVFILGAGVAGLEAIGVFKMLGAEVYCFDVRPVCKEQVESMGGKFVEFKCDGTGTGGYARQLNAEEIKQEQQLLKERAVLSDIIICTAAIPGRRAPILLTRDAVESMKSGSVIVDISSRTGGNCEVTRNGSLYITNNGVTILGSLNLPGMMPRISSEMYGGNIIELLKHMGKGKDFIVKHDEPTIQTMLLCNNNNITYGTKPPVVPPTTNTQKPKQIITQKTEEDSNMGIVFTIIFLLVCIGLLVLVGFLFPINYYEYIMIFMLSCYVGYLSVWGVSPSLHTPLMSVTNAISGVVILGAIPLIHEPKESASLWLGMIAIFFSAINIGGGFYVTHRMLSMFIIKSNTKDDKKEDKKDNKIDIKKDTKSTTISVPSKSLTQEPTKPTESIPIKTNTTQPILQSNTSSSLPIQLQSSSQQPTISTNINNNNNIQPINNQPSTSTSIPIPPPSNINNTQTLPQSSINNQLITPANIDTRGPRLVQSKQPIQTGQNTISRPRVNQQTRPRAINQNLPRVSNINQQRGSNINQQRGGIPGNRPLQSRPQPRK